MGGWQYSGHFWNICIPLDLTSRVQIMGLANRSDTGRVLYVPEDIPEISSVESLQAELRSSHADLLASAASAMSAMSQQASTAEPRHPALDVISRYL
jgi:hypothetical protein